MSEPGNKFPLSVLGKHPLDNASTSQAKIVAHDSTSAGMQLPTTQPSSLPFLTHERMSQLQSPGMEEEYEAAVKAISAVSPGHESRLLMERLIEDGATWLSISKEWQKLVDNSASLEDLMALLIRTGGDRVDKHLRTLYDLTQDASALVVRRLKALGAALRNILGVFCGKPTTILPAKFIFDLVSREELVRQYSDQVLLPRFNLFQNGQPDKDKYGAAFLYGQSGIGKSRMSRDLIPQALRYLSQQQHVDPELLDLARGCKICLISLREGKEEQDRVQKEELKQLPIDVILGLRVAAKYFDYPVTRVVSLLLIERNKSVRHRFSLASVLDDIEQEYKTAGKVGMLHLALDDIHSFFETPVHSQGVLDTHTSGMESVARAMMRAVMSACNTASRSGLFVVATFAGTTLLPPHARLSPMDEKFFSIHLPPLPLSATGQLLESHFTAYPTGITDDPLYARIIPLAVRQASWFPTVLRALGGVPQAVQYLCQLPSQGLLRYAMDGDPMRFVRTIGDLLQKRYVTSPEMGLLPYLALSGIPLPSLDTVLSPPGTVSTTIRAIQEGGYASVVKAPPLHTPWVQRWGAGGNVLVDMPLALVVANLTAQPQQHISIDLWRVAGELVKNLVLYHGPVDFKQITLLHQSVRSMTASHLAVWQGRTTVSARELFCGADCTEAFVDREFKLALSRTVWSPIIGEWCEEASKATPTVPLRNGSTANVVVPGYSPLTPFAVRVSGSNAVDALLNHELADGRRVLQVLDTIHVDKDLLDPADPVPQSVVTKWSETVADLHRALNVDVLGALISLAPQTVPDEASQWLEDAHDDWTCVITPSAGRLAWSLSPVLAYVLEE